MNCKNIYPQCNPGNRHPTSSTVKENRVFCTGPPTHSVGGAVLFCWLASVVVCHRCLFSVVVCRLSSSVTLRGGSAGGFTRASEAMTSCRQSNYSSMVTLHGGPVVLWRHLAYQSSCVILWRSATAVSHVLRTLTMC